MEDEKIVMLYWERNESAIRETEEKYGKYCFCIADNILHCKEDSEECVNDTWVRAWNAMPPERPTLLQAFLGKITRNLALDRYSFDRTLKRGSEVDQIADEYWQCIPSDEPSLADQTALHAAINGFLGSLSSTHRIVFMQRYWYFCTVGEIARSMEMSESTVKVTLLRTRNKFKEYLEKEGIFI